MKAECYTYAHGIQIMIVFHIVNQIDPFDFFLILGAGMISLRKLGTIGWILMPAWTCTLSDPRREEEVQVHKQYLMWLLCSTQERRSAVSMWQRLIPMIQVSRRASRLQLDPDNCANISSCSTSACCVAMQWRVWSIAWFGMENICSTIRTWRLQDMEIVSWWSTIISGTLWHKQQVVKRQPAPLHWIYFKQRQQFCGGQTMRSQNMMRMNERHAERSNWSGASTRRHTHPTLKCQHNRHRKRSNVNWIAGASIGTLYFAWSGMPSFVSLHKSNKQRSSSIMFLSTLKYLMMIGFSCTPRRTTWRNMISSAICMHLDSGGRWFYRVSKSIPPSQRSPFRIRRSVWLSQRRKQNHPSNGQRKNMDNVASIPSLEEIMALTASNWSGRVSPEKTSPTSLRHSKTFYDKMLWIWTCPRKSNRP